MQAKVTYIKGLQFVGEASSGHAIVLDGDHEAGGANTGLRPSELLLIGLGGCSGMDIISILKKKRQDVTGFEIKVDGTKADSHPKKFTDIKITYLITGRSISEDAVKRAVELSMDKYCSVKATIEGVSKITFSYEIKEQP
jgi:putative redox protein